MRLSRFTRIGFAAVALAAAVAGAVALRGALRPDPMAGVFAAGEPLGVTLDGVRTPMSANVTVYGAVVSAESCSFDEGRGLIVVVNRGVEPGVLGNDGFVSLLNPDGSVHTAKWIGAAPGGYALNQPLGSDIADGVLYVADQDGGGGWLDPPVAVIRKFDLATGAPAGALRVAASPGLNDIAVAADGVVYATQSGARQSGPEDWRVYRIAPDGAVAVFADGEPLRRPNGVALSPEGDVVVANAGDDAVLTFAPDGALKATERAAQPGSDGLVILPDGVKYVSSVQQGGVSRLRPGQPAELIATGVPSPASMCLDPIGGRLVIPMNLNNALAFVPIP